MKRALPLPGLLFGAVAFVVLYVVGDVALWVAAVSAAAIIVGWIVFVRAVVTTSDD
jgi:hypothetical protein